MLRNSKRSLKSIKKEIKHIINHETYNDVYYEYILMLENRFQKIKKGSKGQ